MSLTNVADALGLLDEQAEHLMISYETFRPGFMLMAFEVMFNPSQLKFDREVDWKVTAPAGQAIAGGYNRFEYQSTSPLTLTLDLFYDTYEGGPKRSNGLLAGLAAAVLPDNPFAGASATDVTDYTEKIARLVRVDPDLHRPPMCELWWGRYLLLRGVMVSLGQEFNFFRPNGMPVRANLACKFKQCEPYEKTAREYELHSPDVHKRRVVRRGDTLHSLAREEYNDASLWRHIAQANGIDNPRRLTPGQVVAIPSLKR